MTKFTKFGDMFKKEMDSPMWHEQYKLKLEYYARILLPSDIKLEILPVDNSCVACRWIKYKLHYKDRFVTSDFSEHDILAVPDFNVSRLQPLLNQLMYRKSDKEVMEEICRKDKPKMTREEAIELAKAYGNNYPWDEGEIRLLEALGLIKFDEPKTVDETKKEFYKKPSSEKGPYIFFPHPDGADNVSVLQADAVATLERYGYKVEKRKQDSLNDILKEAKRYIDYGTCIPVSIETTSRLVSIIQKFIEISEPTKKC